jgi:hypothetical protein
LRVLAFTAALLAATPALAAAPGPADSARALELLKTSIGYRTTASAGQEPILAYAGWIKGVLVAAGYSPSDIVIEPIAGTATLVARLPGRDPGRKPMVISAHMDVVEARAEDWTRDPFTPVVENGYVFGRGAADNKFDISMVVATLTRLRAENWRPGRDVILALTGDEETLMRSTAVLAGKLKGADLVLNADGGGGEMDGAGKAISYGIQGAEKTYADFTFTVTDPGGHSSRPTPGNPIYRLARALERVESHRFPVQSNEITRASLAASGRTLSFRTVATVAVQRPDKLHVIRQGGFALVEATFDGKVLSVLNRDAMAYALADLPGSVDALVTFMHDELGRPVPGADLLLTDPAAVLMGGATDVKDLGAGVIGGTLCDHFAVRTADVDWQIWVAQGDTPYPCRYIITNKSVAGWPEYRLNLSSWGKGSAAAEFVFEPPAGAKLSDVREIPDLDEVAGVFVIKEAN